MKETLPKHIPICKNMFQRIQEKKDLDNLPPMQSPVKTESQEVSEMGGISREQARKILRQANGDLMKAK